MIPTAYNKPLVKGLLAYSPITFFEEVSQICMKTVSGSCTLSSIWLTIKPQKGSLIKYSTMTAGTKVSSRPTRE